MRSRYAAYAVGKVDYIRATTDPNGPQWEPDEERWNASIRHFSRNTRFVGLQILDHQEDGDRGMVRFYARLSHAGQDASFGEESQFVRRDGRWLYHSGARATPPPSAPGPRR